jgi:hypothetical protein
VAPQEVDPVRNHDSLGVAGAPTRKEQDVGIPLAQGRNGQVPIVLAACTLEQFAHDGERDTELRRQAGARRCSLCVRHEQGGAGQADGPGHLVGTDERIEGREHCTQLGQGGEEGYHVEVGSAPHGNPIPDRDALRTQRTRQLVRFPIDLLERQ